MLRHRLVARAGLATSCAGVSRAAGAFGCGVGGHLPLAQPCPQVARHFSGGLHGTGLLLQTPPGTPHGGAAPPGRPWIVPRPVPARSPDEFYHREGAEEATAQYIKSVIDVTDAGFCTIDPKTKHTVEKFTLFGSSGVKGIGKTEWLLQTANNWVPKIAKDVQKKIVPLYINFHGGSVNTSANYSDYFADNGSPRKGDGAFESCTRRALAYTIAKHCEQDCETSTPLNLTTVLDSVRGCNDVLVLLVDEVAKVPGRDGPTAAMSALMREADVAKGKFVCLFAHINKEILEDGASGSGRVSQTLSLPPLPIDIWKSKEVVGGLKPSELVAATQTNPALHQLLLLLSGHPRSLFEGLPQALQVSGLLTSGTLETLAAAREQMMLATKFNSTRNDLLTDIVPQWLVNDSVMHFREKRQLLIFEGLLHRVRGHPEVEFLFPLHVWKWAEAHSSTGLAVHLQEMYRNDTGVSPGAEKAMEAVMMNWEAALRLSIGGTRSFSLKRYYGVEPKPIQLRGRLFNSKIPTEVEGNIEEESSFAAGNMPEVVRKLAAGYIVTSSFTNERGVEYFTPFTDAATGKLCVACVQCKFVQEEPVGKCSDNMQAAMRYFQQHRIEHFPVYFTAMGEDTPEEHLLVDGIILTAESLFSLTSRLGILRLHCLKLGNTLKQKYPFLAP